MNAPAKLAGFCAALVLLFAGGALAGGAVEPDRAGGKDPDPHETGPHAEKPAGTSASHGDAHGGDASETGEAAGVRGLAVAEGGLRLVVDDQQLERGEAERLRFRIVDDNDKTVRDFDVEHTKRMHLIVARRDLTGFQHLHPTQAGDGTWSTDLKLDDAGSYRLFADFSHEDTARTLATDLRVDGAATLRPLPAPARAAKSDGGYEVRVSGDSARPGKETELKFAISKNGTTVHPEPYLGAGGHLVALCDGDLAFLHVHPTEHADDEGGHDDAISFSTTFPTAGKYRLFLQFHHEGRVQTVAFTQEVK